MEANIKVINENDGIWTVWNKSNGECSTITKITEHGMLASKTAKYRVDHNGKTISTMIVGLHNAKTVAKKAVM